MTYDKKHNLTVFMLYNERCCEFIYYINLINKTMNHDEQKPWNFKKYKENLIKRYAGHVTLFIGFRYLRYFHFLCLLTKKLWPIKLFCSHQNQYFLELMKIKSIQRHNQSDLTCVIIKRVKIYQTWINEIIFSRFIMNCFITWQHLQKNVFLKRYRKDALQLEHNQI